MDGAALVLGVVFRVVAQELFDGMADNSARLAIADWNSLVEQESLGCLQRLVNTQQVMNLGSIGKDSVHPSR